MTDVAVLILHPEPAAHSGDLAHWVAAARAAVAERHRLGFLAAGAADVTVASGPPDGVTFGARLREFVADRRLSREELERMRRLLADRLEDEP